ncbi:HGGxSTG domain-containing protein [Paenibacillus pinistramenti]|uniref:HGGxSTG domain-containing protein n=1 Tax=Paenibacillus pinistramenti TaxID=1768003 RepID=UPI0011096639|nr:HGGxSTG domain-containing protein [Paenibacillus pinistramenti]
MMRGQTVICGAKTRKGTYCINIPMKNGRCRMHGGKSTGPKQPDKLKGNQNAIGNKSKLSTGEYETITWGRLEDWERESIRQYYGMKPDERVTEPLEIEFVRRARMMQRMNEWDKDVDNNFDRLLQLEDAMTRVSGRVLKMIVQEVV